MRKMSRKLGRLEAISFVTGFCLLTYELAAARVLAPTIGSSTYVWTSVIGVIIASLALGFWVGGKLADARDRASDLALLLCLAGVTALGTLLMYPVVLEALAHSPDDVRLVAVYAAVVLFAPTSFVIGLTSPYIAKLNVRSLKTTGQKIASIDALNAVGGITGTFLTGFILFGYIGSRQTFLVVALLLVASSWLLVPRYRLFERLWLCVAVVIVGITAASPTTAAIIIDTPSAHYEIKQYRYPTGEVVRGLTTGPGGIQSAVYTDGSDEPVFWYTKTMLAVALAEQPSRILVLGGGAFTLPQALAQRLPDSQIDVVEIDPQLGDISRQYFGYKDPGNVRLIFTDARTYVNQPHEPYELVLVDVYGDASIPYSLMTSQYGRAVGKLVAKDGIVVANIIAGLTGPCREVLDALNQTYRQHLPHAYYALDEEKPYPRTNILALYSRQPQQFGKPMPAAVGAAYTDNYMPAERLHYACQQVTWAH